MALTRATKAKRLASLDAAIKAAGVAFGQHTKRASEAEARRKRLQAERDWLAQAPVADPLPAADLADEPGGGEPS